MKRSRRFRNGLSLPTTQMERTDLHLRRDINRYVRPMRVVHSTVSRERYSIYTKERTTHVSTSLLGLVWREKLVKVFPNYTCFSSRLTPTDPKMSSVDRLCSRLALEVLRTYGDTVVIRYRSRGDHWR